MEKSGTFGVFTLYNGEWKLHSTWSRKSEADREATYLRDMLGLVANVFVKNQGDDNVGSFFALGLDCSWLFIWSVLDCPTLVTQSARMMTMTLDQLATNFMIELQSYVDWAYHNPLAFLIWFVVGGVIMKCVENQKR